MFVGVAVGFELAHELAAASEPPSDNPVGGEPRGGATIGGASGRESPKNQSSTEEP
jgi:hypothetical protein